MNPRFSLVAPEFRRIMETLTETVHPGDDEFQYWRNTTYDYVATRALSLAHKELVIASTQALAQKYGAIDVATSWTPYSGVTFRGMILDHAPSVGDPVLNWCNLTTVPLDDYGPKIVYLAQASKTKAQGKMLTSELEALHVRLGPLIETSDFILKDFDLFGELGTYTMDGKKRATPVRVWTLSAGVFIRTTKNRNYDIPRGFERVPQCVLALAQDIENMLEE